MRKLWFGWRLEAAREFGISATAVSRRWRNNDPELVEWIVEKLKIRKEAIKKARKIKNA